MTVTYDKLWLRHVADVLSRASVVDCARFLVWAAAIELSKFGSHAVRTTLSDMFELAEGWRVSKVDEPKLNWYNSTAPALVVSSFVL